MGNRATLTAAGIDQKEKVRKKRKSKRSKKQIRQTNSFISKYCQSSCNNDILDDSYLMDQRRVVFVSLNGLYLTWKECPVFIMRSAILLIPLKKQWIYNTTKYKNELNENLVGKCSIYNDSNAFTEFLELLRWKDSQQLVFWMLDECVFKDNKKSSNHVNNLVAPFWRSFSQRLSKLYDPIKQDKYKGIQVDPTWYHNNPSKFNVSISSILAELYFVEMKYRSIAEIIYQSNPTSLNPMISYSKYQISMHSQEKVDYTHAAITSGNVSANASFTSASSSGLFISDDYENDVDDDGFVYMSDF